MQPVGARAEDLDRVGLGEVAFRLRHGGADLVARQAAAHEHDEPVPARDAAAAVDQVLDLEVELVAAARARRGGIRGGRAHAPSCSAER